MLLPADNVLEAGIYAALPDRAVADLTEADVIEAALRYVAALLGELLEQRQHDLALGLIALGIPPIAGPFDDLLQQQRACDQAWQDDVLVTLGAELRAWRRWGASRTCSA